jgi:hypothetical protein
MNVMQVVYTKVRHFFRDAKLTEYYVKVSKEEAQGNVQKAHDMLQQKVLLFVQDTDFDETVKARNIRKIEKWMQELQEKLDRRDEWDRRREERERQRGSFF